jgi:putative membrane protein
MGLAPGGITTFVIEADNQQTCYVVVDSNNAITGLRDKVRNALLEMGFDEAELLTTDTHLASGSLSSKIGFNPLGEGGGEEQIITEIIDCAKEAKEDTVKTKIQFTRNPIQVQTLGKENLDAITTLIASSAKLAKRLIIILLGFGLLAAAGSYFLIQFLFSLI